jgi:hypothetical protein
VDDEVKALKEMAKKVVNGRRVVNHQRGESN